MILELHRQGVERLGDRPPGGARPQDGAQIHRARPGAAAVRPAAATGEQGRAVRALSARAACGVSAADRASPASRAARARLHRRLQHSHRLPARHPADRACRPSRCASRRRPGVRRRSTSRISARCSPTSRAPSGLSGCSRWCSATAACCGPASCCTRTCRRLLRCHAAAFEALGGVPEQILYDRMRTVFSREDPEAGHIVYNRTLLEFARHYGYLPKACKPYRAKTKGKVERPFRYIREDFFLGRRFRNLDDLNRNSASGSTRSPMCASTPRPGVSSPSISPRSARSFSQLPAGPFQAVLRLERRITRDGMVSVDGNLYSVPNSARRRASSRCTARPHEVRILEAGHVIAVHPVHGWARPAAHRRRAPQPAAAGQQPDAAQRRDPAPTAAPATSSPCVP